MGDVVVIRPMPQGAAESVSISLAARRTARVKSSLGALTSTSGHVERATGAIRGPAAVVEEARSAGAPACCPVRNNRRRGQQAHTAGRRPPRRRRQLSDELKTHEKLPNELTENRSRKARGRAGWLAYNAALGHRACLPAVPGCDRGDLALGRVATSVPTRVCAPNTVPRAPAAGPVSSSGGRAGRSSIRLTW